MDWGLCEKLVRSLLRRDDKKRGDDKIVGVDCGDGLCDFFVTLMLGSVSLV